MKTLLHENHDKCNLCHYHNDDSPEKLLGILKAVKGAGEKF
jgi:hypothetical protein